MPPASLVVMQPPPTGFHYSTQFIDGKSVLVPVRNARKKPLTKQEKSSIEQRKKTAREFKVPVGLFLHNSPAILETGATIVTVRSLGQNKSWQAADIFNASAGWYMPVQAQKTGTWSAGGVAFKPTWDAALKSAIGWGSNLFYLKMRSSKMGKSLNGILAKSKLPIRY